MLKHYLVFGFCDASFLQFSRLQFDVMTLELTFGLELEQFGLELDLLRE